MYLLKNAQVHTMVSEVLSEADVLVRDGKIAAVGPGLSAPDGARVIDCAGKILLPGLIDAHCAIGLSEDGTMYEGEDSNEAVNPITPQLRALDGINPMDIPFREAREAGVTTVCISPGSTNVLGGMLSVLKTCGHRVDDMVIREDFALKASFGEDPKTTYYARKEMPMTRMAIAGMLRQQLHKARDYMEKRESAKPPEFDLLMENLAKVLRREIPLVASAHRMDDIHTALRIAREFDLRLILSQCTEGYLMPEALKAAGYPIILGPLLTSRDKLETARMSHQAPALLAAAGIPFCLSTNAPRLPIQFLMTNAGCAVRDGLSGEAALRAITIRAAETLGLSDRLGSIEPGKDADLALYDGKPFNLMSRVAMVFIDGKPVHEPRL